MGRFKSKVGDSKERTYRSSVADRVFRFMSPEWTPDMCNEYVDSLSKEEVSELLEDVNREFDRPDPDPVRQASPEDDLRKNGWHVRTRITDGGRLFEGFRGRT